MGKTVRRPCALYPRLPGYGGSAKTRQSYHCSRHSSLSVFAITKKGIYDLLEDQRMMGRIILCRKKMIGRTMNRMPAARPSAWKMGSDGEDDEMILFSFIRWVFAPARSMDRNIVYCYGQYGTENTQFCPLCYLVFGLDRPASRNFPSQPARGG